MKNNATKRLYLLKPLMRL